MKRILSLCFSALLLVACTSEEIPFNEDIHSSETGRIKLGIDNLSDVAMTYSTATTEENLIKKCYVIVFAGGTKEFADTVEVAKITNNGSASPILPQLIKNGKAYTPSVGSKIYVIANPYRKPTAAELAALTDTEASFDAAFVGNSPADEIKNTIYGTPTGSNGYFITTLPMSGVIDSYSLAGICPMVRTYAKVEVRMGSSVADVTPDFSFDNVGIYIIWTSPKHIMQSAQVEGYGHYDNQLLYADDMIKIKQTGGTNSVFYLEEFPSSNTSSYYQNIQEDKWEKWRPCIFLEKNSGGKKTYYRIDYYDKTTGKFLDIRRNHHYIITINKVNSEGYKSQSEAINNPASNIEYTVTTESNDNVIESNGQYAIAMTNNECHIFGGGGNFEIAQVRYKIGDGMQPLNIGITNTIIASGTGLTLNSPSPAKITQNMQPINVTLTSSFTSGYVALQLGNIYDTIHITRTAYDASSAVAKVLNGNVVSSEFGNTGITYTNGSGNYTISVPAGINTAEGYIYTDGQNNGRKKIIVKK